MGQHEVARLSCQRKFWANYVSAIAVIIVLGTLIVISTSGIVAAQKEGSGIEDFVVGEVTGKRENLIRIDSKEYSFFADVIVKDQTMTPRTLQDVVPGTQVMFHLKQGRIDQIIILLPS